MTHAASEKAADRLFRSDRPRAIDRFIDYFGEGQAPMTLPEARAWEPHGLAAAAR